MAFTDVLWGGTLADLTFDVVHHECLLRVEVLAGGTMSSHILRCDGVNELRFFNQIPEPWTYAEVTEIEAEYDRPASCWRLELLLWSEQAGLVLRCTDIALDDERQPRPV